MTARLETALLVLSAFTACHPTAEQPTLASLATARGIRMGTFTFGSAVPPPRYAAAFEEFNLVKLPTFFVLVEPEEGKFDFAIPDHVADTTPTTTPLQIFGLLYCDTNPEWLNDPNFTSTQLTALLKRHITVVIDHFQKKYPNRIWSWDVVNEPMNGWGAGCPWHRIGLDQGLDRFEYIRIALRAARDLLPQGKLLLNDWGIENKTPKADELLSLLSDFKKQSVPIDGLGFESHFMMNPGGPFPQLPAWNDIKENMDRFASLGLETNISEADFSIIDSDSSAALLEKQGAAYRDLLRACLGARSCKAFTTWGVGDADSWIPTDFAPGWGHPLFFDKEYLPKPAYFAVSTELSKTQQ